MPTELHLALQRHYAGKSGVVEAPLDGYKADVLRDGVVYEPKPRFLGVSQ